MAYVTDLEGRLIGVSDRWLEVLGYERQEVLGKSFLDFSSDDSPSLHPAGMPLDRTEPCLDVPYRLIRKDGRALDVLLSATTERDQQGRIQSSLAILQDNTEAMRMERVQHVLCAIAEATGQKTDLNALLSHIQAEIGQLMDARNFYVALVHDRETGSFTIPFIADENPEEEDVAPDLLVDLSGGFSEYVLQTEQPLLIDQDKAKEMAARGEIELLGKESASWLGVPLKSTEGHVFGVVAVQSYSDRAAYGENDREVLSIISSTIASAIAATRSEVERRTLVEKLSRSEKMEALGRLAGGVAHDLNNVLNAIVGYPELLMEDLPEGSPLHDPLEIIQDSGEKAAAIVEDLLTLARRGVQVKKIVDLNEVVRNYLDSPEKAKLLAHHPRVGIETHLDPDLLHMQGSFVHLTKTVMNLVSNAAEAMPEGGEITISTSNHRLHQSTATLGAEEGDLDHVVLKVADKGVGIARQEIEKIFEPFYTKKIMGRSGTGLGMAVVWGTVEDHRGSVDVESHEGQGTTFELRFPASKQSVATLPSQVPLADYLGNGEKILVVDDRSDQRAIASRILRRLRYQVDAVAGGEQAIEYLRSQEVDLVILDMIMDPGMDGLETFRRLRAIRPNTRAIIVSGYSESARVTEAQRLGAGEYLRKPYSMKKLGAAVKSALEERGSDARRAILRRDSGSVSRGSDASESEKKDRDS